MLFQELHPCVSKLPGFVHGDPVSFSWFRVALCHDLLAVLLRFPPRFRPIREPLQHSGRRGQNRLGVVNVAPTDH